MTNSKKLIELIQENRILESLDQLVLLLEDEDSIDAMQLQLRYNRIEGEKLKGIIDFDNYTQSINKISAELLKFIKQKSKQIDASSYTKKHEQETGFSREWLSEKLGDKYELLNTIAEGNFSHLIKIFDVNLERYACLKVYKDTTVFTDKQSYDLQKEVKLLSKYKHRNIVKIYAASFEKDLRYTITEYIDGLSVDKILRHFGAFSVPDVVDKLYWIGEALFYGHQRGNIHLGIRPRKILVDSEDRPVISSYKSVRSILQNQKMEVFQNDLKYCSPEVINRENITPSADQFSLGALAYEMLTGEPLFDGKNITEIFAARSQKMKNPSIIREALLEHDVPDTLIPIILKLIREKPTDRYRDLLDAINIIDNIDIPVTENERIGRLSFERAMANDYQLISTIHSDFLSLLSADDRTKMLHAVGDLDYQKKLLFQLIQRTCFSNTRAALPEKVVGMFPLEIITQGHINKLYDSIATNVALADIDLPKRQSIAEAWKALMQDLMMDEGIVFR